MSDVDLVQVARAVVEPLDVVSPGQPAVRAVAQSVVGVPIAVGRQGLLVRARCHVCLGC